MEKENRQQPLSLPEIWQTTSLQILSNKRMIVQGIDKLYRYNPDFYY